LRDVIVLADKRTTTCKNYSSSPRPDKEIKGPILHVSQKNHEYVHIPWLDNRSPRSGLAIKCFDCGDYVENGIQIELSSADGLEKFGFCCETNYVRWWFLRATEHRDWKPEQNLEECPKNKGQPVNSFNTKPSVPQILEAIDRLLARSIFPKQEDGSDPRHCPNCDTGKLSLKFSHDGVFIGCSNYPECRFSQRLSRTTNPAPR
jgi:ssDNA-binding Zn-finger/Zn-ribbon topoisomerase 1